MAEKNLKDLLLHTLKDVYFAEHEILKALPEMAKAAGSDKLRQAFETHRSQTEQQVQRLNDVFSLLGEKPEGVPCEAIQSRIAHCHCYDICPALISGLGEAQIPNGVRAGIADRRIRNQPGVA